ncbi:MAG TPA: RNA polymerase sigma factor [Candidatus Parabacteroides intestinavium]|nr:RNA polymerase sigma factor [Candidatus Parabacteroides intestinavium]
MESLSDTYYIERILAGDTSCFASLFDRYGKQVYAWVCRVIQNREDAEELTEDVFVKAFQHLESFRGESDFLTWLYRIAYNLSISAVRKKKVEYLAIEDSQLSNISEEMIQDQLGQADSSERLDLLDWALEQLPPDDRALILLFYKEDKSIEELAQIMGLSIANIKVKLHRTRKKLYILMTEGQTTKQSGLKQRRL